MLRKYSYGVTERIVQWCERNKKSYILYDDDYLSISDWPRITLVQFESPDSNQFYLILNEDIDRFQDHYIGADNDEEIEAELEKYFYDEEYNFKLDDKSIVEVVSGYFDSIITCGSF